MASFNHLVGAGQAHQSQNGRVIIDDCPKARKPRTKAESDHGSPKQARGLGVGKLARELILAHPDWTYGQIAEEVNRRIEGAKATEKSVRWYSNAMRREGIEGTRRSH